MAAANLVDVLRQCHVLESNQLDELLRADTGRFADERALASELLKRGWLTAFQANQLLQGRGADLMLGSYVLLERIGEGGMGQVFKARHTKMGRIVALKLIRQDKLANPEAIRRFEHEIRAAARLFHPNVVTAYDADQVGQTNFFVMEYVEGSSLDQLVRDTGPLPVEQACAYIQQAALGLQHAHDKGMVHRDIKPTNLLLSVKEGQVKILDLGLARTVNAAVHDDTPLTLDGAVIGTPDYGAPEQARQSHEVDIRSDLYSLGCSLYFLLTGRPPFPSGTATEKLLKHQLDEPQPVEQLNPEVPPGVAQVVRKLMAKRREDRYQTPDEVVAAVNALGIIPPPAPATTTKIPVPTVPTQRRRLVPVLVVGGVLLALVVGGAVLVSALQPPAPHPALGYVLKKHPVNAVEFKGHWYLFVPDKAPSWQDARARCREMGGYLACVGSADEQEFIMKLVNGQSCWLGGYVDDTRRWQWITGEPITQFFWVPGQPNNGAGAVLEIFGKGWHDIGTKEHKTYAAGFVCEWE